MFWNIKRVKRFRDLFALIRLVRYRCEKIYFNRLIRLMVICIDREHDCFQDYARLHLFFPLCFYVFRYVFNPYPLCHFALLHRRYVWIFCICCYLDCCQHHVNSLIRNIYSERNVDAFSTYFPCCIC